VSLGKGLKPTEPARKRRKRGGLREATTVIHGEWERRGSNNRIFGVVEGNMLFYESRGRRLLPRGEDRQKTSKRVQRRRVEEKRDRG